ncbi:hypothetical protein ACOXXX_14140 [Thalassococcus sp. BH17M4-6]|uniref:hypothetical protein n=1 Tax=Thalassococcus sp. BH17M4-6 TaxID=3413148 RepID=UPI003BE16713
MRALALLALLLPATAFAQEFDLRDSDQRITPEALAMRLSGHTLTFYDDGQAEFYTDGRYTYTYADNGGTAYGYWSLSDAGTVCIAFVNGFSRCDLYVRDGDRLVMLDAKGARYPVRP